MQKSEFTPDDSLGKLKEGNRRYSENYPRHPNQDLSRRKETAEGGQHPVAAVLACADSRVPVEVLFDVGVGDIFVVRVAGNVIGAHQLGSIEYAVEHLGTPLVLVLGHTKCGAVTAVVEAGVLEGNLQDLSEQIMPAVKEVRTENPDISGDQFLDQCIKTNVLTVMANSFRKSACIRENVKNGTIKLVGAIYDIESGQIDWMGTHPNEVSLCE
jgi:carbonic anhydrase